ncbi:phage integrase, N-terminal SAM-like domain protein, partial [Vibrio parahaemolyticus V-223/04]
KVTVFSRP